MQMNSIRHVLSFLMAVLIFSMPVITFAQTKLDRNRSQSASNC